MKLQTRETVRKRPGMYIGPPDAGGLTHCVFELVASFVDRSSRQGGRVDVVLHADGSCTVRDDGPGFLTHCDDEGDGLSNLEKLMTNIHHNYIQRNPDRGLLGLAWFGPVGVNFLSERFSVWNSENGQCHTIGFERGMTTQPLRLLDEIAASGTVITFKPDPEIFEHGTGPERMPHFDAKGLARRLRELALFKPGLRTSLTDERPKATGAGTRPANFYYPGGLTQECRETGARLKCDPIEPVVATGTWNGVSVECAWTFRERGRGDVDSFVNMWRTPEGGTHLAGFRAALLRSLRAFAAAHGLGSAAGMPRLAWPQVLRHLVARITVVDRDPSFCGPTRAQLASRRGYPAVYVAVTRSFRAYLEANPIVGEALIRRMCLVKVKPKSAAQIEHEREERRYYEPWQWRWR